MPVFRSGEGLAPAWCEMRFFEIVELPAGATRDLPWIGPREKLILGEGRCRIAYGDQVVDAEPGANLDLRQGQGAFRVLSVSEPAIMVRMCGDWGDETGGSGRFTAAVDDARVDRGDPVDYPKSTGFDSHYHDCDEYWILYRGRGIAVTEGISYAVGPGDCIATGMGHHHDIPQVHEHIGAVYFETTMRGQKRRGHLWNHTCWQAQPDPKRI